MIAGRDFCDALPDRLHDARALAAEHGGQRHGQLHAPLQDRIRAYERRIEELERELADKGEENRQLIGARIDVARQQLRMERERGGFGAN